MIGKTITLLCICLLILFTTGCWNRVELNELAISVGQGIDKEDDKYKVSTQIVIPSEVALKAGATSGIPVTLFTGTEETVFEAMREITTVSPRKIYHSHLRILVIGEELAKEGIGKVLDFYARDHEYRTDFYIVIAKDTTAENILSMLTTIEKIPSNNMLSSLETSEKTWAPTTSVTLHELIRSLVTEGKSPILTGIEIIGDPSIGDNVQNIEQINPAAYLKYSGIAVFKRDRMLGWLNEEQSRGYNIIMDNVKNTVANVQCPSEGELNFEVIQSKTKVKGDVENGIPKIDVSIEAEGNIGEVKCAIDLTKPKTIYELEKLAEESFIKLTKGTIKTVQEDFGVDIFGFGDIIHRSDPELWKKLKKDWNEKHFTDLEVNVKADIKIRRLGKIGNSFLPEMKE
ncbi:Ger(x)C family spore germination protein [uncultured Rossellomorea sp.]|uniref:Ger(x)C family spore germination protein n=1 Tax=uncultured Rossellomorea sp. TaxID=2837549 RepID=UPI002607BA9A|nr:Ger(x)C family spore germination protein [uncultured Rossellomorea sp.]